MSVKQEKQEAKDEKNKRKRKQQPKGKRATHLPREDRVDGDLYHQAAGKKEKTNKQHKKNEKAQAKFIATKLEMVAPTSPTPLPKDGCSEGW